MRRTTTIALLPMAALVLAACGGDTDQPDASGPAATLSTNGTASPESTDAAPDGTAASPDDALFGTPADVGGPYGELRDGVWEVGPAGEVEFRVTGSDTLELVEVRPNDGWNVTSQDISPDEIEIDFQQGPVEFEIEIEIEGGVLEIEIDQDIDPAEGGTFAVGEAATVDVSVEDGRLVLGDVTVSDGWSDVSRDIERDDIELDFRRDGNGFIETWELDADLDGGDLEIEIDFEIEGLFAQ